MPDKAYVVSLGGSLIVPKAGIDWKFLKKFRDLILEEVKAGKKFYLVAGGGRTARDYIEGADRVAKLTDDDRDWLGIHATRLNAHLLRTVFRGIACPEIITNPEKEICVKGKNKKIIIGSGFRPGNSTDYVAVLIAEKYGVKTIVNLSNIDYAYDRDPNKFPDAKKLKNIDWKEFRRIVGNVWRPGLSAPFDPIASRQAEKLGLEVVIMNGRKLGNLKAFLDSGRFKGTRVVPAKKRGLADLPHPI